MTKTTRPVLLLISTLLLGCEIATDPVEGGPGTEVAPAVELSGSTVDYFAQTPVAHVPLETMGLAPEQSGASGEGGEYRFAAVPPASWFFVRTAATDTHRPTIGGLVVGAESTESDVYVVAAADVQRQHATVGLEVASDSTMVIVELVGPDGAPLANVGRENLIIVDSAGMVIATNPYVFGALGDIDPSLDSAQVHRGSSRMAFLNVAAGIHQLSFRCATCVPAIETSQTLVAGAGVTLSRLTASFEVAPSGESFEAVYPLFARGVDGGVGCANCHTAGGVSPVLDGNPSAVYQVLRGNPLLVNVAVPELSRLLSKPLYELPADHPNATFLTQEDPVYQALRTWIAAGAQP